MGASIRLMILGSLEAAPSYTYGLIRSINDAAKGAIEWKEGTVYPLLQKLEQEGLVRSEWHQRERAHPRKYYFITRRGRAVHGLLVGHVCPCFGSGNCVGVQRGTRQLRSHHEPRHHRHDHRRTGRHHLGDCDLAADLAPGALEQ